MKIIIYIFCLILIYSCDFKKRASGDNTSMSKNQYEETTQLGKLDHYLKISLDNYNLFIGKMYSINENISEDYAIDYKNDTIWVKKLFSIKTFCLKTLWLSILYHIILMVQKKQISI